MDVATSLSGVIGALLAMNLLTFAIVVRLWFCDRQKWFHVTQWMLIQERMNRSFIAAVPESPSEPEGGK